jgi:hypothetical protein
VAGYWLELDLHALLVATWTPSTRCITVVRNGATSLAGALLAVGVLVAAGSASSRGEAIPKAPTAAVCVPKTVRMEYFSFGGGKLGEYDAPFGKVVKVYPPDPYSYKCLWMTQPGGTAEAFVVFLDLIPAGLPGRIASGDCARNRRDNPPFYYSRKRYLTVSGGNRIESQRALGGNEKIFKGVLAAAEAAGGGVKCPGTRPPPKPPAPKPKPPPSRRSLRPSSGTSPSTTGCLPLVARRQRPDQLPGHARGDPPPRGA